MAKRLAVMDVEHLRVGAMSAEAALTHFRRQAHRAVITGGDRADIQQAARDTSTRCLILTGSLYPSPVVPNRADELGGPALLADRDTLSAIEIVEGFAGRGCVQPHRARNAQLNMRRRRVGGEPSAPPARPVCVLRLQLPTSDRVYRQI